jgi:hypothetical protein
MFAQSHTHVHSDNAWAAERLKVSVKKSMKAEKRLRCTDLSRVTKATMATLEKSCTLTNQAGKPSWKTAYAQSSRKPKTAGQPLAASTVSQPLDQPHNTQLYNRQSRVWPCSHQTIAQHAATLAVAKALGLPHSLAPASPSLTSSTAA